MTKKQKLIARIKELLIEKGANESNKLEHDIYLIDYRRRNGDPWYGKITDVWLDKDGNAKCHVWYWGTECVEDISTLTCTNLGFVLEYLTNGYIIQ